MLVWVGGLHVCATMTACEPARACCRADPHIRDVACRACGTHGTATATVGATATAATTATGVVTPP